MPEARTEHSALLSSRNHRHLAWAILACFVLLGLIYSIVNPVLESLDEIHHYAFIQYVADGNGLPVQRPGVETSYEQEGSQPPLYYLLGAGLTAWIDTNDFEALLVRNPHARIGIGLTRDNQNMLIHSEAEAWPWRGTTLAVRLVRWLSLLLATGTLWGVYRLGLLLLPQRPAVALGAMAFTAFNPMFIYLSASVNNDNLVTLLATWTLVQLVTILYQGWSLPRLALLGASLGAASLAKVSGLALWPLAILALALETLKGYEGLNWRQWPLGVLLRRWLRASAIVLGVAVLIGGWWYARNISLYGELTGVQTMLDIFGRREQAFTLRGIWEELLGFRISYWGLFGAVNIVIQPPFSAWVLEAILWIGLLGAIYLLASGRWAALSGVRDEHRRPFLLSLALLAIWIVVLHISLLRWTLMTPASQGRLIFPSIAAISLLWAWGSCAWPPAPRRPYALWGGCLVPLILAIAVPWTTLQPAYAPPPRLAPSEIPVSARPFGATYGEAIELLAYEIQPKAVSPGQEIWVTLYWRALAPMDENYSMYLHLFGREGHKIGFRDSYAGMGKYPTSRWQPGEIIRDTYALRVAPEAQAPVAAELEVGLYRLDTMERLPCYDAQRQLVGRTVLARVKIEGPGAEAMPSHALDVTLGQGVRLLGYDLAAAEVRPGDAVPVVLYWETAPLPEDYQVLVHLLAADGALIGQGDGPPLQGEYPTSYWGAGEHLVDAHTLLVSEQAPVGEAQLCVGLYSLMDGRRLPVHGVSAVDDRIPIARLHVYAP